MAQSVRMLVIDRCIDPMWTKIHNGVSAAKGNRMLNGLKGLPTSHVLGWVAVVLLATVIVLVFVRRLVGIEG